jgi:hypothetical protein
MYVRNLSPSLVSLASSIVTAEEQALRDHISARNLRSIACCFPQLQMRLWSSVLGVYQRRGDTFAPAALLTEPQDQCGSSQRWVGGTLAATPKTIPCPGIPAAAEPASSLSTSLTLSDSDEPISRRRRGRQVKGQLCQVKFLVNRPSCRYVGI